jgi:hypothetical protein
VVGDCVEVSRRKARVHHHADAVVVVMDCGEVGRSGMANLTRHCICYLSHPCVSHLHFRNFFYNAILFK